MDKLLNSHFIDYINQIKPSQPSCNYLSIKDIKTDVIDDVGFDIQDKQLTIKQLLGAGSATYQNTDNKIIAFVDYEYFLNLLPPLKTKNMRRCDFIVYDLEQKTFFLLNELSQSSLVNNKRTDAKQQLHDTLQHLYKVSDIKLFIDSFDIKLCIFSNKTALLKETPNNIADAFIEIQKYLPEPIERLYKPINKLQFKFIETAIIDVENLHKFN